MKNKKVFSKYRDQKISTLHGTIILVIIAITAGVFVWLTLKNQDDLGQSQVVVNAKKPAAISSLAISQQDQQKLSEEKDKHGCLISSGYFWCEEKQSCFQNWGEVCGNIDILDVSKWEYFNSQNTGLKLKFNFSFKFPSLWFDQGDTSGGSSSAIPFYSKNDYSRQCQNFNGNSISCKQNGGIASIRVWLPSFLPREVKYNNKQINPITINNYKGSIIEGVVEDKNGGSLVNDGQKEIRAIFYNIKGTGFEIIMQENSDSDKDVFNKIISTLRFGI